MLIQDWFLLKQRLGMDTFSRVITIDYLGSRTFKGGSFECKEVARYPRE